MESWVNALLLKDDAAAPPSKTQIAIVYGVLGLVVSKLLA